MHMYMYGSLYKKIINNFILYNILGCGIYALVRFDIVNCGLVAFIASLDICYVSTD